MRLGKPVEHLQAALRATFAPGPASETITTVARQVAYFGYLSYDALVWVRTHLIHYLSMFIIAQANSIKFINLNPETAKRIAKTSFRLWFAGIVFSLINGVLKVGALYSCLREIS
jgi:peroxin-11B